MMKRSFSNSEKILLVFLALILLAFAYYMLVHRVVTDSLLNIEAEKQNVEAEIQIAEAKAAKMEAMQQELAELEADGYKSVVPEFDNLSKEIVFLNNTLERTSDYTIDFDDTEVSDNIVRRAMSLEFTAGSFRESSRIIAALQDCRYCCRLAGVEVEPAEDYNSLYTDLYGYTYDDSGTLLASPLTVNVTLTFFEKIAQ